MTQLDLTLAWNGAASTVTTDHPSEAAQLGVGDSLRICRGSGWAQGVGIKRIDFYPDESSKDAGGASTVYWKRGKSHGLDGIFQFTAHAETSSSGEDYNTWVEMEDVEVLQSGQQVNRWYRVKFDNGEKLDPEVINKSGNGGGRWVPTGGAPEIKTMPAAGERAQT